MKFEKCILYCATDESGNEVVESHHKENVMQFVEELRKIEKKPFKIWKKKIYYIGPLTIEMWTMCMQVPCRR